MNNKQSDISRKRRDETLGRALSAEIATVEHTGCCPSEVALTDLLAGALSGLERDRLMAHLASCDRCLATYTLAARLQRQKPAKRRRWFGSAAALAAVAAVVIAVIMAKPQVPVQTAKAPSVVPGQPLPEPRPASAPSSLPPIKSRSSRPLPSSPRNTMETFKPTAVAYALNVLDRKSGVRVPKAPGTHYAFSGAIDPSHAGFRSGVALLDLAAAVNVSSIGDQQTVLDRLVVLLGDDANEVGVKRLLSGDVPLSRGQCLEIARQLERHAEVSGQLVSFRLGAWVEAARMASQHEVSAIVNDVVIEYFLADPGQGKLPAPVREALEKLSRYKEGQVLSDKDYRDIRRLLNEIADIH